MIYAKLFEEILAKPALYVGNRSVVKIKAFIDGYHHAKWSAGDESQDDLYFGFQQWVEGRFGLETSHDWASIILFMSGDDIEAFETTKKLWGEYTSQFQRQRPQ